MWAGLVAAVVVIAGAAVLGSRTGSNPTTTTVSTTLPAPTTSSSSTTPTTAAPTTTVTEPASGLPLEEPVPLRVYSFGPSGDGMAILDLEAGTSTVIAPEHAPIRGIDGAVVTPHRGLIVWAGGVVYLVTGSGGADREILPTNVGPHLRDMLVLPAPDETAWLVQPGFDSPTLIELVGLSDGARLINAESDPGLLARGATNDGIVFNADTGRVVLFTYSGVLREIGAGQAVTASGNNVVWLDCAEPACGELHVAHPAEPTQAHLIEKPGPGEWLSVAGPVLPISAMPFATISPDESQLLIALGEDLDINDSPGRSQLLVVELASGESVVMAEYDDYVPVATWSADGRWVMAFERDTLRVIDALDPGRNFALVNVIPEGFYPLAAG